MHVPELETRPPLRQGDRLCRKIHTCLGFYIFQESLTVSFDTVRVWRISGRRPHTINISRLHFAYLMLPFAIRDAVRVSYS